MRINVDGHVKNMNPYLGLKQNRVIEDKCEAFMAEVLSNHVEEVIRGWRCSMEIGPENEK